MTLGELQKDARNLVKDSALPYRWSEPDMLSALVQGVKHLRAVRPEARYNGHCLSVSDYPVTDALDAGYDLNTALAFDVNVDERWRMGIIYYGAARCLEFDSADTVNAAMSADFFGKALGIFQS